MGTNNDGRQEVVSMLRGMETPISPERLADSVYDFNPRIAKWCIADTAGGFDSILSLDPFGDLFSALVDECKISALSTESRPELYEALARAVEARKKSLGRIRRNPQADPAMDIVIHAARAIRDHNKPSNRVFFSATVNRAYAIMSLQSADARRRDAEFDVVNSILQGINSYPRRWESVSGKPFMYTGSDTAPFTVRATAPAPAPPPPPPPATPRRPEQASKPQRPSREQQQIAKKAFDEKLFPIEQYLGDDGKPRYRRLPISSGIPLSIPPRKDYYLYRPRNGSVDDLTPVPFAIFGILVNPKSGHPMFAACRFSGEIDIFMTGGEYRGRGYFDSETNYRTESYGFSTTATGFPRVHTPSGVSEEGGGFGTVLYSSLCLASHLDWIGEIITPDLANNGIYDGISSMPNKRSDEAEAWWSAAKMRFNLAYEVMATNTVTGVSKPCDVYEYKALLASNMVVAWSSNGPLIADFNNAGMDQFSYDAKGDGKQTAPGNRKALVNMNVSTLSLGVFYKFLGMAIQSGATKKELDGMEHRFRTKTDIKWNPNKPRKAPVRRETAASSGLSWIASGQTREGLMRAAEMPEEYERLAQERLDLGWPFMDD